VHRFPPAASVWHREFESDPDTQVCEFEYTNDDILDEIVERLHDYHNLMGKEPDYILARKDTADAIVASMLNRRHNRVDTPVYEVFDSEKEGLRFEIYGVPFLYADSLKHRFELCSSNPMQDWMNVAMSGMPHPTDYRAIRLPKKDS